MTTNPETAGVEPVAMTAEEHRLQDLKQMAAYAGPVVSLDVRRGFYLASCDNCGWVGSSELCGTDSWGDDSDIYCPRCHSSGADCGKIAARIPDPKPAPDHAKCAVGELIAMLDAAVPNELGGGTFDHSPEEIGLHVMEHYLTIRAALAAIRSGSE